MQNRLSVVSFFATNSVPAPQGETLYLILPVFSSSTSCFLSSVSSGGASRGGDRENGAALGFSTILWSTVLLGGSPAGRSSGNTSAYFLRRGWRRERKWEGRWSVGSADGFCLCSNVCSKWQSHWTLSSVLCRRSSAFWSVITYSRSDCTGVFWEASDGMMRMV